MYSGLVGEKVTVNVASLPGESTRGKVGRLFSTNEGPGSEMLWTVRSAVPTLRMVTGLGGLLCPGLISEPIPPTETSILAPGCTGGMKVKPLLLELAQQI